MKKQVRVYVPFMMLMLAALACASPLNGVGSQPSSADQVATIVASTLQALTPPASAPATPTVEVQGDLLPHSFYYLDSDDKTGLTQVFRIERDGRTKHQITFEPSNVSAFDVSPVDGGVVYIVNNQMYWVGVDGSGRRLLVDGGTVDPNNQYLTSVTAPVFSPDGTSIAYGHQGLNFLALDTGVSKRVIENQWKEVGNNLKIPTELYWPETYSPDGKKLLITLGYYEGASAAVYAPEGNVLVRLSGDDNALICCDQTQWSVDGSSFYSASRTSGMYGSGLWKVDASSGAVTALLTSNYDTHTFNYAFKPYLAPDGQLYFFFLNSDKEIDSRTPLQLVRSAPDGETGRTVLRSDTFELMNDALWASDASFVVVAFAPTQDVYMGGQAAVTYLDGRPSVVLTTYEQEMKWGP